MSLGVLRDDIDIVAKPNHLHSRTRFQAQRVLTVESSKDHSGSCSRSGPQVVIAKGAPPSKFSGM